MNIVPKLISDNPELLLYLKLTGFDRLKVTLKIICGGNTNRTFRHNLDLYNSVQSEHLVEKASEALDIAAAEGQLLLCNDGGICQRKYLVCVLRWNRWYDES
jgi:hypothetical protein